MSWLPDPDTVQHISLPLELIGLFLVMLELFYPQHATRVEKAIDQLHYETNPASFLPYIMEFVHRSGDKAAPAFTAFKYLILSLLIHGSIVGALSYSLSWKWGLSYGVVVCYIGISIIQQAYSYITMIEGSYPLRKDKEPAWRPTGFWVSIFALPYLVFHLIGFVLIVPISWLVRQIDRVGKGHAIGGIGLLLGAIGFTMEVYQVIMIDIKLNARSLIEVWAIYILIVIALGIVAFFINRAVKNESATVPDTPSTNSNALNPD